MGAASLRRFAVAAFCALWTGHAQWAEDSLQEAFSGSPKPVELRRRLAALPTEELPHLFRVAVEARLVLSDGSGVLPLDDAQREAVQAALVARPRRELLEFLDSLTREPLELRERLEAHRVFSAVGSGEHLRLLLRLSSSPGEVLPAQEIRASLATTLAEVLRVDERAMDQVPVLFSESPPGLSSSVVEALAQVPGARATQMLARLLGRVPGLDALLLGRLAQRAGSAGLCDEFVLDGVRRYLRHGDPALASAACRAASALGDDGSVEALIALLEHEQARVRSAAAEALRSLSGLAFALDHERWASWYQVESRWWSERAEGELARIEGARGQEFVRAARQVLEHRLYRGRIAEAFVQALARRDAEEVWMACRALGELRSRVAIPALIECLEHPEKSVREAAWRALRDITGADLPPEAASWARFNT